MWSRPLTRVLLMPTNTPNGSMRRTLPVTRVPTCATESRGASGRQPTPATSTPNRTLRQETASDGSQVGAHLKLTQIVILFGFHNRANYFAACPCDFQNGKAHLLSSKLGCHILHIHAGHESKERMMSTQHTA